MTDHARDDQARDEAAQFWETHYRSRGASRWTGRPNAILKQWTEALAPGSALDLGCGEGNSAVWLAGRGWQVTGVDLSATALRRAAAHAAAAGVTDRTRFERHDLTDTCPAGPFGLVYALYLESPVALPRGQVLRKAAGAVAPGGLFLAVSHGSVTPWSWNRDATFPTPQQALDALGLDLSHWSTEFLGDPERELNGPGGQTATVRDTIVALRRRPERPA